jgi:hypothetical protein
MVVTVESLAHQGHMQWEHDYLAIPKPMQNC